MTSKTIADSYETFGAPARSRAGVASSLRHRLPVLIFTLLAVLGGAFSWMAYHEVVSALRAGGAERLAGAGRQVADLLGQSAITRLGESTRLAAEPAVRQTLGGPAGGDSAPAAVVAFTQRNPLVTVWLYDGTGRLIRPLARGAQAPAGPDAGAPPMVPDAGVGPLKSRDGRVWYHTTVPIAGDAQAPAAGFLSIQRSLGSTQAMGLIERLIGSGATLKLGNASGDVWTDLRAVVPAPPATAAGATTTFTTPAGERRMGSAVPVSGAPWVVWVEMSEASILDPAATLLRRMVPVALVLTAFGALAVYAVEQPDHEAPRAGRAGRRGDDRRRLHAPGRRRAAR